MRYEFVCPECGHHQIVEMRMSEYTPDGHKCEKCNAELQRDVNNMVAKSIDKTGGFYRKFN